MAEARHHTASFALATWLFAKNFTAPGDGQTSKQAPHEMHLSWWMMCSFFTSPVIASTGHALKHRWQPLHSSGTIS